MNNIFQTFHILYDNSWAISIFKLKLKEFFSMVGVIIGLKLC